MLSEFNSTISDEGVEVNHLAVVRRRERVRLRGIKLVNLLLQLLVRVRVCQKTCEEARECRGRGV